MKHIVWFFFVTMLAVGCETESEKKEHVQSQGEVDFQNFFRSQEAERYALLSAKYNVDTSRVANLIEDYLKQQDIVTYLVSTTLQGKQPDSLSRERLPVAQTIDQLSTKYSVPRSTVASIIIDYKLLRKSTCRDNSE